MAIAKYYDAAQSKYIALPLGQNKLAIQPNEYSTDEQVVGVWTNGKPIYRKIITGYTLPTSGSTNNYALSTLASDIETTTTLNIYSKYKNQETSYISVNQYTNASSGLYMASWISDDTVYIRNFNASFNGSPVIIFLEYTKTTDAENSFDVSMLSFFDLPEEASDDEVAAVFA